MRAVIIGSEENAMRTSMSGTVLACTLILGSLVLVAPGTAAAATSCHKINAKVTGQDDGRGHTTASISGGGLLHGTNKGDFTFALPDDLNGTVIFTTNRGTLTVTVAGTFNISTGAFHLPSLVASASGKLAGATGSLTLDGTENLISRSFVGDLTGTVCVDLAP